MNVKIWWQCEESPLEMVGGDQLEFLGPWSIEGRLSIGALDIAGAVRRVGLQCVQDKTNPCSKYRVGFLAVQLITIQFSTLL